MMRGEKRCLLSLFLWIHLSTVQGVTIRECPEGGITLREDRFPAILTCEGLSETEEATWILVDKGTDDPTITLTCSPAQRVCFFEAHDDVIISKVGRTSQLYLLKEYRNRAGRNSIQCRSQDHGDVAVCSVDAINPARISPSDCRLAMSNTEWSVSASCDFFGAFSKPSLYHSMWYRQGADKKSHSNGGEISKDEIVKYTAVYYNGTCSVREPLPQEEGEYTYTLDLFPGPDTKPTLQMTIQSPGEPVTSCPNRNTERTNILCDCLPNDITPGSPLPTVQWRGYLPGQRLTIPDLTDVDPDQIPVCELTWGPKGIIKKESQLAFGPESVTIIKPQGSQSVDEDLSLFCTVSNSFPGASISWRASTTALGCQEPPGSSTCTFQVRSWHDRETVTCEARNTLFPDTLYGSDAYTIRVA